MIVSVQKTTKITFTLIYSPIIACLIRKSTIHDITHVQNKQRSSRYTTYLEENFGGKTQNLFDPDTTQHLVTRYRYRDDIEIP